MISTVEQDLAAHAAACPRPVPCLMCRAYGELLDARNRLQVLATVVELARSGLASALLQATGDDPAADLPIDLTAVEQPVGAVLVPLHRLPMRQDTPTHVSTPADAPAEADQAPTT